MKQQYVNYGTEFQSNEIDKEIDYFSDYKKKLIQFLIVREYQEMTLNQIACFFINNNRHMDHSTVLHSLKNYEIYIKYNPKLKKWHDFIVDSLFESGDYNESFIVKRKILKDRIDCLNKKNLDELLLYSKALASEQAR